MPSVVGRAAATLFAVLRSAVATFVTLALLRGLAARVRRSRPAGLAGGRTPDVLRSLYDRYPHATAAGRRRLGLRTVSVDEIVGTARDPSQNTADFLPLPMLRGRNWDARWQRILRAMNDLRVLPPVELFKVGDEYYVVDGHNRIAAARQVGQVAVDADVVELLIPGVESDPAPARSASALIAADELWQAGSARHSATVEQRPLADTLSRQDLLRVGAPPPPAGSQPTANEQPSSPTDEPADLEPPPAEPDAADERA
jgi:hypothetical protein